MEGLGETEMESPEKQNVRATMVESEIEITDLSPSKKKVPNNINDKGPALAEMVFAGGSIVGPMLGGALDDWKGFDFTTIIMSSFALFFAVLYTLIVFCPMTKAPKDGPSITESRKLIMQETNCKYHQLCTSSF